MDWLKILEPLKFYISAHNSQPFKLEVDGLQLRVFVDEKRMLPVADPHQRDLMLSLGAFLGALEIVLQANDLQIQSTKILGLKDFKTEIALLQLQVNSGLSRNPSSQRKLDLLKKRFAYRGAFQKQEVDGMLEPGLKMFGIYFSKDPLVKSAIAKLFDKINHQTLARKDYLAELYSWMRFSKEHPRWAQDGLNAESAHLHGVEAWGASVVLKPAIFGFLNAVGLGGMLISEKPQITSAQFIVAFTAPANSDFVAQGKIFYDQWLNITELGLFGAPLSLLTEQDSSVDEVKKLLNIPADKILVNILRCGVLPKNYQRYAPARLEINQFLQQRS